MSSYTTKQGDSWDLIAYKVMGSEQYTDVLMRENSTYKETVVFTAGIDLTIPDVETQSSSSLPPWKRITT